MQDGALWAIGFSFCVLGCASAAAERPEPVREAASPPPIERAAAPEPPAAIEAEVARSLPAACEDGPICTLPAEFASRLCAGVYPEVALHLFAPKTPWKRAYLQRSFKAWHVGGRGDLREVRTGEEVIIARANRGDSTDLGGRAFDVLRWDGTCVSLMEDEISFRKPSPAAVANIAWKKLEPAYQSAFFEDRHLASLRAAQSRACEGADAQKEPGKSKCELATRQLSVAIAQLVGSGKALPPLAAVP